MTYGKRDGPCVLHAILWCLHLAASAGGTELGVPHLWRWYSLSGCFDDDIFKWWAPTSDLREAPRGVALLVLKASPPKAALGSSSSRLSPWEHPTSKQQDPELRGFFIRELEQRGNGDSGWGDSFFAVWSNPMPVPLPTSRRGVPHLSQGCRRSGMEQLPQGRAYLGVRQKQCFHQRRK